MQRAKQRSMDHTLSAESTVSYSSRMFQSPLVLCLLQARQASESSKQVVIRHACVFLGKHRTTISVSVANRASNVRKLGSKPALDPTSKLVLPNLMSLLGCPACRSSSTICKIWQTIQVAFGLLDSSQQLLE